MSKPVSSNHALYIGAVFGLAMRHGIMATPVVDDDNDYTDEIVVQLGGQYSPTITLIVPPPPDDWSLADFMNDGHE